MKKLKQIAGTGITRRRKIALTLFTILILLQQQVSSQEVIINQEAKEITLSKKKTIDVAKIIKNEKRLRQVNAELIETIRKQDSVINKLTTENVKAFNSIDQQNKRITALSSDILRLSDLQLGYSEKKTKVSKLFVSLQYDFAPQIETNIPGIGLDYFTGSLGFGLNTGFVNGEIYYGGRISFALW